MRWTGQINVWAVVLLLMGGLWLGAVRPAPAANLPPLIEDDDEPLPGQPGGPPGVKPPPKDPAIFKGMIIGCLGDDWTVPSPAEKMNIRSYPMALQALLDGKYGPGFVEVIAAGQPGASITEYDKIYKAQLEKRKPDLVIIQDADKPNAATGFKMDLTKLMEKIKANKTAGERIPKVMLLETFHDMESTNLNRDKVKEFHEARDWVANNKIMQDIATANKGQFIELRGTLGPGFGILKEMNYTRPFRADGLVPSYIGATLIAMKILDSLGEDLENYNYRAWNFPENIRVGMIGIVHGRQFVGGKMVDDESAVGPKIAPELKQFDRALRVERRVLAAYFGGDEMGSCAWIGQNAAWLKTYYGPKVETMSAARPGDTSKIGLERMEVDVLKYKPSLLMIAFAFSDARDKAGISLEDSRANLSAMIEKTRKLVPECDIVLVTTHSLNTWGEGDQRRSDLSAYYKVVREVAAAQKVGLIDNSAVWDDWAANNPDKYNELIGGAMLPGPAGQLELSKQAEAYFSAGCPRVKK